MIIADACCNHLGDDRIIERMIELCPVRIIKFQLFDADDLSEGWKGEYNYYKSCQLSDKQVSNILHLCSEHNVTPLFTCFTQAQMKRAFELGVRYFKIASPNADDDGLVAAGSVYASQLVISTGMSSRERINALRHRNSTAIFLKCISKYPAVWTEKDKDEALLFDGISDHSFDLNTAKWAISKGLWVERHYTLGKDLPGKDHRISSLPSEFEELQREEDYYKKVESYKTRWLQAR